MRVMTQPMNGLNREQIKGEPRRCRGTDASPRYEVDSFVGTATRPYAVWGGRFRLWRAVRRPVSGQLGGRARSIAFK